MRVGRVQLWFTEYSNSMVNCLQLFLEVAFGLVLLDEPPDMLGHFYALWYTLTRAYITQLHQLVTEIGVPLMNSSGLDDLTFCDRGLVATLDLFPFFSQCFESIFQPFL